MSLHEGSADPLPELPEGFNADGFSMETLWLEEDQERARLFSEVRRCAASFENNYSVSRGSEWQSFNLIPGEARECVWLIGRPGARMLHIIRNRESYDYSVQRHKLEYAEFTISSAFPQSGSLTGEAFRQDRESWNSQNLGHCALAQLHVSDTVVLYRGTQNRYPTPYDCADPSLNAADKLEAGSAAKLELANVRDLLVPLSSGQYYVESVTGTFT